MLESLPTMSGEEQGFGRGLGPSGRAEGIELCGPVTLERLYRTYSQRVYSLCVSMTGDVAEAEDLTQEAFVHLYRKLDTFRGQAAFFTWFYRLVVNLVLMRLRKKKRSREVLFEDTGHAEPKDASFCPLEATSTDTTLLGAVDRVDIQRALDALPPGFRMVFVLHDIEGYEHQEISRLTGLSIGTSKSQLHKARLRMRTLLREGHLAKVLRRRGRPRIREAVREAFPTEPVPAF